MTPEQEEIVRRGLKAATELKRFRKLDFYEPYPKQAEFHRLGAGCRERGLIAANRVGKSECAAAETAIHMTGEYPKWWEGHRFKKPIIAWAAGETGDLTRDVIQAKLCGPPGIADALGTGYLPKEAFVSRPSLARGTTDLFDTIHIRCKVNGRLDESAVSALTLKSFREGRVGFQGGTIDWGWEDEEADAEIHSEFFTRLATTNGLLVCTFTPLLGRTTLVKRFKDNDPPSDTRAYVQMGTYDAGHFTREQADALIASYPEHERGARAYGEPMMGEGRVFLVPEAQLKVPPFPVPAHWFKLGALDFGGQGPQSHPFAYVLLAHDRDTDVLYLVHSIRQRGTTKLQHIPAIRAVAAEVPVAWPHDGNERREGQTVAQQYRDPMPGMPGLNMLPTHATWPDGGFSTWAAVKELDDRCQTERFKVFDTPANAMFFEEYRQYHMEDQKLVPIDDDLLSAVFKGLMAKRYARMVSVGPRPVKYAPKPTEEKWWQEPPRSASIHPHTGEPLDRRSSLW